MEKNLKQIADLVNNQENLEDEKKFKVASATLVCNIVGTESKDPDKYCSLFQENFNVDQEEFNQIKNKLEEDGLSIDEKVHYIKEELGNNMFQIMQFLKILNKFAISDGCSQKSYNEFEIIRDKFLKDEY
ncbi:MAG: Unknown protein [uncultured Sulfurovum sp.]|uniref:Co-chaperone DjlA N-terminal domain-containing protein n=1 Tax=uncultured Sulfurovum sp. TaxID=269237 RepID=A0A6S6U7T9_9BACT|nr:MAG: Unknown protein [uncultured Sulfurovum sp.]